MIRNIYEEESSNVTNEEKNEYHFSILNFPIHTDSISEAGSQAHRREECPFLINNNVPQMGGEQNIANKLQKEGRKTKNFQEIDKRISMNSSLAKQIFLPSLIQDEFLPPATISEISDIRLVRWKNESKKDNAEEIIHGLLIKGKITQSYEETECEIDEYRVSFNYFLKKKSFFGDTKLEACRPLWVALANFFNISKMMMYQVNKVLKNVRFSSLFIYIVHKVYQRHPQPNFVDIAREISVKDLLSEMPHFIQECINLFFDPIYKGYEGSIDKDKINSINDICLLNWQLIESELKDFEIFSDLLTIINKIQSFMFIKVERPQLLEKYRKNSNLNFSEIFFHIMLFKIENFYKTYYPYCCGLKHANYLDYAKAPYVICIFCQLLVCNKCFKFHRKHNYFDMCTIIRNKKGNIHSDFSNFLNSNKKRKQKKEKGNEEGKEEKMEKKSEKSQEKAKKGVKTDPKGEKKTLLCQTENFGEDLILQDILKYLHSNIIETIEKFLQSTAKDNESPVLTLGIVDMMDIIMLEYLLKTIYPMAANQEYYHDKVEEMANNEFAANCFQEGLKKTYSNSCEFSLEWINLYRERLLKKLQMEEMQKEVLSNAQNQKDQGDDHHHEEKQTSILHPAQKKKDCNILFNRGDILRYFPKSVNLTSKKDSYLTDIVSTVQAFTRYKTEIGLKFDHTLAKTSATSSYKPRTNHLQEYFKPSLLDKPINFFPTVKYFIIEKMENGTSTEKYVDGFGSLFDFIFLYCENIYSKIYSFGLIK